MQSMHAGGVGRDSSRRFVRELVSRGCAGIVCFGLAAAPVFAEDIQVNTPSRRGSTVRSGTRPAVRRPAPTVPRPIAPTAPAAAAPSRSQEQAVDLSTLSSTSSTPSSTTPAATSGASTSHAKMGGLSPHGNSGILPNFKFYFDFLAKSWKGDPSRSSFDFDSYHQRMLVEFTPTPELMFQADISAWQTPEYFEVDYQLTKRLQLRWGKIWIPFDDMSPHSIFGGRINTSEFFQGNETAFLPSIWADAGMGLKYDLADSPSFSSTLHLYVVNGFQSNTNSPVAGENGLVEYPDFGTTSRFSTTGATDNNNNKALGARWQSKLGRRFSLGGSVYNGAYTNKTSVKSQSITMIGGDAQLRPTNSTEIRVGLVSMKVGLNAPATKQNFTRAASYVELGQRFGHEDRWKFLIRAGKAQNDNRVVDVSDKTLVGFTLLRSFGNVEGQFTFYKDMNKVPSKIAYNYGHLRLVTAF